jgi:hypothetical protein
VSSSVSRFITGIVFVAVSGINLVANGYWLRTGDIHQPNFHAVMRAGWTGLLMTPVFFSVLLVVGTSLLLLKWRALRSEETRRG